MLRRHPVLPQWLIEIRYRPQRHDVQAAWIVTFLREPRRLRVGDRIEIRSRNARNRSGMIIQVAQAQLDPQRMPCPRVRRCIPGDTAVMPKVHP